MGCSTTTEPHPTVERLTARPGTPTIAPTIGLSELGLGSDLALTRDGLLYVPESYSSDTPAPLFVGLHGAGGDADNWESYPARAESRGMVFLAPDSRSFSTWDGIGGSFGPDVEFINRALEHTFERCLIDPDRIALGGFSDGASYALSLGIRNGDLFSHLVAYSPGFYLATDSPVGLPPVYVSHGTWDDVLPAYGSREVIVPTLREQGHDVTFEEFDGGHEVPAEISESALNWFLA
jgi:phospholipase/carboxylesterase